MTSFAPIPLGQRIPDRLHAVSCSLPTMRDVIGYEERDPEVARHMTSGYPRFVVHPCLQRAAAHLSAQHGLSGQDLWLTSSPTAARALLDHLADPAARQFTGELPGVSFPADPDLNLRAKKFLQHTGMFASSRAAEDYLVRHGLLATAAPEPSFAGDARAHVAEHLAAIYGAPAADVHLAPSGMNAIHAALRVAADIQRAAGRTRWVQLGWLYLDTIALLQKFAATGPGDYHMHPNVAVLDALHALFAREGHRVAGVFAEVPTNPLIQTPDLAAVAALCRRHGALLIVDPSIASPSNIDVLPHADLAVNSLTKYAASEGDVIVGAAVVNPASPHAAALRERLPAALEPVYPRDLARLAAQIGDTAAVIAQINRSAPAVIEFLRGHPAIKSLHWSRQPGSLKNYDALARSPDAVGSMISFTLNIPLARFYDRLRLPKGPSFGMKSTLICPFIYLAHYDLVTTPEGRAHLAANGLDPELLRLSIGCEPAEDIVEALREALA